MKNKFFLFIISCIIISSGCTTTPFSNRSQLIFMSLDEEMTSGLTAWESILKESKESKDSAKIQQVQRVGKALAAVANQPKFTWEFKVLANEEANAFCLPGGKIAVYEGLFPYISSDDELAVVLSHEIAHAILRHGAERSQMQVLVNLTNEGVKQLTKNEQYLAVYGVATQIGATLPYSRKHEYEADAVGLQLMNLAKYDPKKALDFWKKFGKEEGESKVAELFSTHPISANRIKKIEENLAKLNK